LLLLAAGMTACTQGGNASALPAARGAGFVDMDKIILAHPLHGQIDSLQTQIVSLSAKQQDAPRPATAAQAEAEAAMQRDLAAAQTQFQDEISQKRAFYQQQEAQAVAAIENKALAGTGGSPVGNSMQQQFGEQVKQVQTQAGKAYLAYQQTLYKADNEHLSDVSRRLHADVTAKMQDKRNKLEAAETAYQLKLSGQDQDQKLNLKIKLESGTLTPEERAQYAGQLQNIQTREDALINRMKSADNDTLTRYQSELSRDAAKSFDAERTKAMTATQGKLLERQKQMNEQLRTTVTGIGSKFQQQANSANEQLAKNPQVKADIDRVHSEQEAKYSADFKRALAAYVDSRRATVAKYSAIAHMQFQDDAALAEQVNQLTEQRRELLAKIVDQVKGQVADIARKQGVAVVLMSVRGAGAAVDLTDQVSKAVAALPSPAASP
jgi:hypothetical protein